MKTPFAISQVPAWTAINYHSRVLQGPGISGGGLRQTMIMQERRFTTCALSFGPPVPYVVPSTPMHRTARSDSLPRHAFI